MVPKSPVGSSIHWIVHSMKGTLAMPPNLPPILCSLKTPALGCGSLSVSWEGHLGLGQGQRCLRHGNYCKSGV